MVIGAISLELWNDFEEMERAECILNSEIFGFSGLSVEELNASLLDSVIFEFFYDFLVRSHFELLTHFLNLFHDFFLFFEIFLGPFLAGVAKNKDFDAFLDLLKESGLILKLG